ncbi:MAG: hypothetical protein R2850_01040 [Bacteroidia bacterium]
MKKHPPHFVSDYGFGLIYQLIHGYHGLDFLIYDVFDQLIWMITGFYVIKITSFDDITAFFVCIFPLADASFLPYYTASILVLCCTSGFWKINQLNQQSHSALH